MQTSKYKVKLDKNIVVTFLTNKYFLFFLNNRIKPSASFSVCCRCCKITDCCCCCVACRWSSVWRKALFTSWWTDFAWQMDSCPMTRGRLWSCSTQCIWVATPAANIPRSVQQLLGLILLLSVGLYRLWSSSPPGPQRSHEQRDRMHTQLQDERGGSLGGWVQLRHLALLQKTHMGDLLWWRLHFLRFVQSHASWCIMRMFFFIFQPTEWKKACLEPNTDHVFL